MMTVKEWANRDRTVSWRCPFCHKSVAVGEEHEHGVEEILDQMMNIELLKELRAAFVELNEDIHAIRGNPRVTWQSDVPEFAALLKRVDEEITKHAEQARCVHCGSIDLAATGMKNELLMATCKSCGSTDALAAAPGGGTPPPGRVA